MYDVRMENRTRRFAQHYARHFGRKVKIVRTRVGMTQADVAEKMSAAGYPMSRVMIAKTETAGRPVSIEEAAAFAAVLNVPVPFLLPGGMSDSAAELRKEFLSELFLLAEGTMAHLDEVNEGLRETYESLRLRYEVLGGESDGVDSEEA